MHHGLFISSPTEAHLGCYQVLEILNKASINTSEHVFVGHKYLIHLGKYQGAQYARQFIFVRNCQIVF